LVFLFFIHRSLFARERFKEKGKFLRNFEERGSAGKGIQNMIQMRVMENLAPHTLLQE
jgi:hypothetical protein